MKKSSKKKNKKNSKLRIGFYFWLGFFFLLIAFVACMMLLHYHFTILKKEISEIRQNVHYCRFDLSEIRRSL
ncbi:MAG: hypothetical protein GY750_11655 [Lentisphaerae bacterium]|nr:hypothetical protein [Lentisphaerota bacterium]MCP4102070.1 hypothetical protein [Lentisphaerota bacterium]